MSEADADVLPGAVALGFLLFALVLFAGFAGAPSGSDVWYGYGVVLTGLVLGAALSVLVALRY